MRNAHLSYDPDMSVCASNGWNDNVWTWKTKVCWSGIWRQLSPENQQSHWDTSAVAVVLFIKDLVGVFAQCGGWFALRQIPQDHSFIRWTAGQHVPTSGTPVIKVSTKKHKTLFLLVMVPRWNTAALTGPVCSRTNPAQHLCDLPQAPLLPPGI